MYHSNISKNKKKNISIQDRIEPKRWERIEIAARVGESILTAKTTRSATQRLSTEQIAVLMNASGIVDNNKLKTLNYNKILFPRGNLGDEVICAIADQWRDSNIFFPKNKPDRQIKTPILLEIGVTPAPANYKRKAV